MLPTPVWSPTGPPSLSHRDSPQQRRFCFHPHPRGKLCFAPRFTANILKRQLALLIRCNYQFRDPESSISETPLHSSSSCSLSNIFSTASHRLRAAKAQLRCPRQGALQRQKRQQTNRILEESRPGRRCAAPLCQHAAARFARGNPDQGRAAGTFPLGASLHPRAVGRGRPGPPTRAVFARAHEGQAAPPSSLQRQHAGLC